MEFLFGLLNLQFDFMQHIWQTFLLETADKWSVIPLLLRNTRLTAEAAEVSISIRPCHTTRFWCGKMFHLLHHLFYPGIIQLNLRVMIFWRRRSRSCRRRGPFYNLVKCTRRAMLQTSAVPIIYMLLCITTNVELCCRFLLYPSCIWWDALLPNYFVYSALTTL